MGLSLKPLALIFGLATLLGLPVVQDILDQHATSAPLAGLLLFCQAWSPLLLTSFFVLAGLFYTDKTLGMKPNTWYIYLDYWEGLKSTRFIIVAFLTLVLAVNLLRAVPFVLDRLELSAGATHYKRGFGETWFLLARIPLQVVNGLICLVWISLTRWIWRTEYESSIKFTRPTPPIQPQPDNTEKKLNKLLRKAEKYVEKGNLKPAAQIFVQLGKEYYYRAGKLYVQLGRMDEAEEAYKQAGSYYLKQGNPVRAGDAYFYGGFWERAVEAYEHASLPKGPLNEDDLLRSTIGHWGDALCRLRRHEDAAKLYMSHDLFEQAASCYQLAERPTDAAQAFLQAGSYEASFKALEDGGFGELAILERGKYLVHQGRHEEAALEFEKLKHHEYAADAYAKAGMPLKAAQCLILAQKPARAAALFLEAGEELQALTCYEMAQDYDKAAEMAARLGLQDKQAQYYELGGHLLLAAGSYLVIYETSEALRCLSQIEVEDEASASALAQLLNSLVDSGRVEEALSCAHALLEGRKTKRVLAPLLFAVARIHERKGKYEKCSQFYYRAAHLEPNNETYVGNARRLAARLNQEFRLPDEIVRSLDSLSRNSESVSSAGLYRPPLVSGKHSALDTGESSNLRTRPTQKDESESGAETTLTLDNQTIFDLTSEGDLSRYQVISELGRGGMGYVYKALDKKLNRMVAIKMLHTEMNLEPRIVLFFKREAKTIAALNHPNLVSIYDMGKEQGCFFMIMEYVNGLTLKQLAVKSPQYVRRNLKGIWLEACAGLRYAHEKGFLHRDIKPSNLMFSKERRIKILDFGLAKGVADLNHSAQIWGTPSYMAPELFNGERAGFHTDIYGLGATFYTLATRKEPFAASHLAAKFEDEGLPPSPMSIDPRIGQALSDVILKCLYVDPARRYPSVIELAQDLRKL